MGISSITMKEIYSFNDKNNYNLKSGIHLTRPIFHTEQNPLQIFEQKYGNWHYKILKKQTPCLVSKSRLRNRFQKDARVVSVRHMLLKLDLFNFFAKSFNAWSIEGSCKLTQTCSFLLQICLGFKGFVMDTRH